MARNHVGDESSCELAELEGTPHGMLRTHGAAIDAALREFVGRG